MSQTVYLQNCTILEDFVATREEKFKLDSRLKNFMVRFTVAGSRKRVPSSGGTQSRAYSWTRKFERCSRLTVTGGIPGSVNFSRIRTAIWSFLFSISCLPPSLSASFRLELFEEKENKEEKEGSGKGWDPLSFTRQ